QHAVVPVVVRRAEPAVEVRRGKHERTPPRERRDLFDRGGALICLELGHGGETIEVSENEGSAVELHVVSDATGETATRVVAAIEYAVKADDGLGRALPNADIVLVGVSRTSKTPLSMYLGYLGWKVANVPIIKGIEPPTELFAVDSAKVVGLTIDAHRLAEIR